MKYTVSLAVAMLLGKVSAETSQATADMFQHQAEEAFATYEAALSAFHDALPTQSAARFPYHDIYLQKCEKLDEAYEAYVALHNETLPLMDQVTWDAFYASQEYVPPENETANATSSNATLLVETAGHVYTQEEWEALQELKEAGEKFEHAGAQAWALMNEGYYQDFDVYYPYIEEARAIDEADSMYEWLDYTEAQGLDPNAFLDATETLKGLKRDVYEYAGSTESINNFRSSQYFQDIFFPAMCAKGGMPAPSVVQEVCDDSNGENAIACEAAELLSHISEDERAGFNTRFGAVLDFLPQWYGNLTVLDLDIMALSEDIEANADTSVRVANDLATKPIHDREVLQQIYLANMAVQQTKLDSDDKIHKWYKHRNHMLEEQAAAAANNTSNNTTNGTVNETATGTNTSNTNETVGARVEEEVEANPVPFIVGMSLLGVGILGVIFCACTKKACFAEKDDPEGGESERQIYKKEIKSKKTSKRKVKESLVPTFNVDEA